MATSATINGVRYKNQQAFKARTNFTGKAASDGTGANSIVTAGTTYTFIKYNPGSRYPYAIGKPGRGNEVRCWVQAAVFPYARYTVRYNANGGSGAPGEQTKTWNRNLTLSSVRPTRTGYTFQGWATSASGGAVYAAGGVYTANEGITLYAVWKINTYSVRYNANGGSGAPGAQTKTYGKTLTLSSARPTRTGYTFQGWAVSNTGSVTYSAGAHYIANATITLYAVWQANTYTVRFHANGGSGSMGNQTYTYGVTRELNTNLFTRAGHTFAGWAKSPGGIKIYDNGAKVNNLTSTAGGVVELYAVWQANTYTITFNASKNGGSGDATQRKTYGTKFGELPTATKKYYVFLGWYTAPTGGTKITEETIVQRDATVYAQYIIDASVYIKANGAIKPGFPYIWHNGSWKKGYTYVWTKGSWKQGLSE